jgi:chromosome segregation ATPase
MKKAIFLTAFNAIMAGFIFTSCESKQEKVEDAKEEVQEAKEELQEAQRELNAEYPTFKTDAEKKIDANDRRIAELEAKINQPGKKPLDEERRKRIEELKQKNAELRSRLYGYENERSDWESFKREWNHDMESLDKGVNDFDDDNVK